MVEENKCYVCYICEDRGCVNCCPLGGLPPKEHKRADCSLCRSGDWRWDGKEHYWDGTQI